MPPQPAMPTDDPSRRPSGRLTVPATAYQRCWRHPGRSHPPLVKPLTPRPTPAEHAAHATTAPAHHRRHTHYAHASGNQADDSFELGERTGQCARALFEIGESALDPLLLAEPPGHRSFVWRAEELSLAPRSTVVYDAAARLRLFLFIPSGDSCRRRCS